MTFNELESPICCPPTWTLTKLSDICKKIGSGATPRGGQAAYQAQRSNFALVRSQNVFDRNFSFDGLAFISDEQAIQLKGVWLEKNDVLINITGDGVTFGRVCTVPESVLPACVNQHVSIIRVDEEKAFPAYVGSFLANQEVKPYIESFNAGGSRRAITKAHIESFVIPLPPYEVQVAIAEFMDALDNRITLLRETNTTLEAMAQALFKSWFVDFDPVHAKQQGRAPEGMDAATAALFPDSFEESELGMVPKGWIWKSLADCTSYLGRGISPKYVERGGIPVLNQKCIRDFSVDFSKSRRHDTTLRKVDGRELVSGDVLVNSTGVGTLGRVAQILHLDETTIVDSHVTVVRAGESINNEYLGCFMQFKQPVIEDMGEGSTGQTELSRIKLGQLNILQPGKDELCIFQEVVAPLKEKVAVNESSVRILAALRDTLLPRLISGQLRLPEAEALAEQAIAS